MSTARGRHDTLAGLPPATRPGGSPAARCAAPSWSLILLAGLILMLVAPVAVAQAERCSPDGKICLLTDASAEHPYLPPLPIQLAVDSAASQVGLMASPELSPSPAFGSPRLVTAGPPGGMSLWEVPLGPVRNDSTISITVGAGASTATFTDLPVLATALPGETTIRRIGGRYVATFGYTARQPIELEQTLYLTSPSPYDATLKGKIVDAPIGTHTTSMSFRVSMVKRFCERKEVCVVSLDVGLILGATRINGGGGISRVKSPRPRCLERIKELEREPAPGGHRHRYLKRLQRVREKRCYNWTPRVVPSIFS